MNCRLWRQDDNGNCFLVGIYGTRELAEVRMAQLARCLHRQIYWVDETVSEERRGDMFEVHYNEEMEQEVRRLEARQRADAAGHPEWDNACIVCGSEIKGIGTDRCPACIS